MAIWLKDPNALRRIVQVTADGIDRIAGPCRRAPAQGPWPSPPPGEGQASPARAFRPAGGRGIALACAPIVAPAAFTGARGAGRRSGGRQGLPGAPSRVRGRCPLPRAVKKPWFRSRGGSVVFGDQSTKAKAKIAAEYPAALDEDWPERARDLKDRGFYADQVEGATWRWPGDVTEAEYLDTLRKVKPAVERRWRS